MKSIYKNKIIKKVEEIKMTTARFGEKYNV